MVRLLCPSSPSCHTLNSSQAEGAAPVPKPLQEEPPPFMTTPGIPAECPWSVLNPFLPRLGWDCPPRPQLPGTPPARTRTPQGCQELCCTPGTATPAAVGTAPHPCAAPLQGCTSDLAGQVLLGGDDLVHVRADGALQLRPLLLAPGHRSVVLRLGQLVDHPIDSIRHLGAQVGGSETPHASSCTPNPPPAAPGPAEPSPVP